MRYVKFEQLTQILKSIVIVIGVTMGLFYLLTQIYLDYYVIQPGSPVELSGVINVENDSEEYGNMHLTTVNQSPANLVMYLYGIIYPYAEVQPREEVIPPEMDREEYQEMMEQHMIDSQNIAKTIALEALDYNIDFSGEGIRVLELADEGPAQGILQEGDIITQVNGENFYLAEELTEYISEYPINEYIELKVDRDQDLLTKEIQTQENPDNPSNSYLGVYIRTEKWEPILPVDIEFDTGGIGGPSAGLMFVLEIINQLSEGDLSSGYEIYGTGAVDMEGYINTVGGVQYKVRASESEGADYFLVPEDNYQEAEEVAKEIDVIEIQDLDEALDFLENL